MSRIVQMDIVNVAEWRPHGTILKIQTYGSPRAELTLTGSRKGMIPSLAVKKRLITSALSKLFSA